MDKSLLLSVSESEYILLQGFKFKTLWYHSNNYNQVLD